MEDPQLTMTPEPEPYGKQWRAEMLDMIRDIAATTRKIYEQRAQLANQTQPCKARLSHPIYRRMDSDRLVILGKNGRVECVYFILTPDTAKKLDIQPGIKGRTYDDLTCNPKAESGHRSVWCIKTGQLCLMSRRSLDVPCENEWEIYSLKTNEAGLLVKDELLDQSETL